MNTPPPAWDDAQIHAFVDGALDAASAARLRADCVTDPLLAARVAQQQRLRDLLRGHFDPVLDEPVPPALRAMAEPAVASVTPLRASRAQHTTSQPAWWGALAASLLLGVAVGWWGKGQESLIASGTAGPLATGTLSRALSTQLSSTTTVDGDIRIVLSFRNEQGQYCRAFALPTGADGLACRGAQGWMVQLLDHAPGEPSPAGDHYRQAGSTLSPAVLAAISAQQADDSLDADAERALRDRHWQDSAPASR